ncbi:AIR synthase family protein [Rhodohalobacter sulfatireducens]|uniref:AIR synthase family protein n=1 Tax=Rhodohalobacter sulfatireducens TaxID=2911366 RepID=A0ABS9KJB2_9BACT|nr:AIR synthase family protein [Rhodohalobacter sulfatireducens]MCG2590926.1 AIR synthase family protein [Rhodohalobacter sulfatireducens]
MSAFEDNFGKIGSSNLNEILLPRTGKKRRDVRTGPGFGVDTSVIDLGNNLGLAISSDPLSLIPSLGLKESAWLSVHLLVNDMATTGFSPQYAQFVLNLSPELSKEKFEEYWEYVHQFCKEVGVAITGGHTGQIEGQNSTIPGGGSMFLSAPLDEIITSDGAEPGDLIIVTKETALNSTAILAMSFPETVKNNLGKEVYQAACDNFYRTSSLPDALAAAEILENKTELKAMHDVTEGGVLGAIAEMAEASGCGFTVDDSMLPVGEAPKQIAELFEIDHRFCVGAGSMIMAVKPGCEEKLIEYLENQSIPATVVGEMTENSLGRKIIENSEEKEFSFDGIDPYWAAFFKAIKAEWK